MNKINIAITSTLTIDEIRSIITEKIEKDNPKFKIISIESNYRGNFDDVEFDGFNITYNMRNL